MEPVALAGEHAEQTVLYHAMKLKLTPTWGGTTNAICKGTHNCQGFIEGMTGRLEGSFEFRF